MSRNMRRKIRRAKRIASELGQKLVVESEKLRHRRETLCRLLAKEAARMPQDVSGYQVPPGRPRAS